MIILAYILAAIVLFVASYVVFYIATTFALKFVSWICKKIKLDNDENFVPSF